MNFTQEDIEKLDSRASFLLTKHLMPLVNLMTMEERGLLLTAILAYGIRIELVDMSSSKIVEGAFNLFKQDFIKEGKRYLKTCDKNKENIEKRWSKR